MDSRFCSGIAAVCVIALVASPAALASHSDKNKTISVNCDSGRQLGEALDRRDDADRGLTVVVTGTCTENVTIERDDVVLRADPSGATISAPDASRPAIRVDGARRVALEGLVVQGGRDGVLFTDAATGTLRVVTVRNAAHDGVSIERGSNVAVDASLFESNGRAGMSVDASHATITGSTSRYNSYYGVFLLMGASAVLGAHNDAGDVCCGNTIVNNRSDGVLVTQESVADLFGNDIENNGAAVNRFGVLASTGGTVWLRGGNVISHNGGAAGGGGAYVRGGILRAGGGDVPLNPPTNDITANRSGILTGESAFVELKDANVSGNSFTGILLDHGTRARLEANTISSNGGHGLFVSRNSSASFLGAGNTVSGNGAFGLYCADGESSFSGNTIGVAGNGAGNVNCTGF